MTNALSMSIIHTMSVTEQRATAQWSYVVSDHDFCNHHWFGCALFSFTARMHGGGGASNSEARRKVWRWLMVGGAEGESCRGSGKVLGESMLLERKSDRARCSQRGVD